MNFSCHTTDPIAANRREVSIKLAGAWRPGGQVGYGLCETEHGPQYRRWVKPKLVTLRQSRRGAKDSDAMRAGGGIP